MQKAITDKQLIKRSEIEESCLSDYLELVQLVVEHDFKNKKNLNILVKTLVKRLLFGYTQLRAAKNLLTAAQLDDLVMNTSLAHTRLLSQAKLLPAIVKFLSSLERNSKKFLVINVETPLYKFVFADKHTPNLEHTQVVMSVVLNTITDTFIYVDPTDIPTLLKDADDIQKGVYQSVDLVKL